ncbi:hypothetical protein MHPYR_40231 [uncultured Mycobacterium sp.]|uniref:Uncharacterized protein n=1 Tax=uncultured Mycobacterium sp. TaxID=171292 RepID=A0A1Y5PIW2_9MYCO|nr:hypothetical protein MHPYR_40231 [uncultured Mycobacterium sp.]
MRWYHWDPFTHISKEQATIGALRKSAEGHDVSIQALSKHEHVKSDPNAQLNAATTSQR